MNRESRESSASSVAENDFDLPLQANRSGRKKKAYAVAPADEEAAPATQSRCSTPLWRSHFLTAIVTCALTSSYFLLTMPSSPQPVLPPPTSSSSTPAPRAPPSPDPLPPVSPEISTPPLLSPPSPHPPPPPPYPMRPYYTYPPYPPYPSPPVPPPEFERHRHVNCYVNHGATALDGLDIMQPHVTTAAQCERKCVASAGCIGFVLSAVKPWANNERECYLRSSLNLAKCESHAGTAGWDTFQMRLASPLPPPPAPPSPPHPPAWPPACQSHELAVLNRRFVEGQPSDQLAGAGVIVRQTDWFTEGAHLWSAASPSTAGGKDTPSATSTDRLAASIINHRLPHMFSTSAVGVVISPEHVEGRIYCSYPRDGNSMNNGGEHGCDATAADYFRGTDIKGMLQAHERTMTFSYYCQYGAPTVNDRSGCQYNEVVLDAAAFQSSLPGVVEAFFVPINGPVEYREGDASRARTMHAAFTKAFHTHVPLFAFDVVEARAGRPPFFCLRE